mgnify:CR=1 FL=1
MDQHSDKPRLPATDRIAQEPPSDVEYRPVPHSHIPVDDKSYPTWCVRFDLASDPSKQFGLAINGEIVFGRGRQAADFIDLSSYDAEDLGVSRRHVMLRPAVDKLYVLDLGSTNGTWRNGRSIGVKSPHHLINGDTLALGRLQFIVRIAQRPTGQTAILRDKADLADVLTQMAKAITSQLELDEVLNQVADAAMALTAAGETGVWLVDEQTGELFLEAQRGIEDERIQRLRIPVDDDTLAGQVIRSGKSLRASREPGGEQIKVKTDYLVESLVYVPLKLGGVTIGVLSAAHRDPGKKFSERDERLLGAIADFAAIAVQNSRIYEVTDQALVEHLKELAALNELMGAVSSSLDLNKVHAVLLEQVHKHWKVEAAALWLVNQQRGTLHLFPPARSEDDTGAAEPPRVGRGIVGSVAQSGKPLVVSDAPSHPGYDPAVDKVDGQVARSMACVPLLIQDRTAGVLALFNKQEGEFTDRDVERLMAFANPVATAVENARLFAESERERATVHATINMLTQPFLILGQSGDVLVSNEPTESLVEEHLAQLLEGLSESAGRTTELTLGDKTYITTTEHVPRVGTIVVMQDITYVKELEKAQSEFVHALSHDLKSPLTAIRAWAHMMDVVDPTLDEQRRGFVQRIVEGTDRMLLLIGQLLDIALLSEGPKIYQATCNLIDVSRDAVSDLEGVALEKSIAIDFRVKGEPYLIRGDNTRLYRSVLNLIDNALKYSPENTKVAVTLTFGTDGISIQVRDQGDGIPEEDVPHLFDKYYRGKQAIGPHSGVGLGLVMVQATAKAHGGEVAVRNVEGNGAEFTIKLPATLWLR